MKVAHILHNSFINDSRVLKELQSISKLNQIDSIFLVCVMAKDLLADEEILGGRIKIKRISKPNLKEKFFLLKGMGFIVWIYNVLAFLKQTKPNILHCHDLTGLIVGFLHKLQNNVVVIYDSHEFQTEVKNLKGIRKTVISLLERFCILNIDHFITVSESIAKNYQYRYGLKYYNLILNCPHSESSFKRSNILKSNYGLSSQDILFIYQGSLSRGRGIELLLNSFEKLRNSRNHIVFMGKGELEEKIVQFCNTNPNMHFCPSVKMEHILEYTSSADVGICLTDTSCLNHIYCLPNKFFEYINAGIPVITTELYELSKIIQKFQIGFTIRNETTDDLIQVIKDYPPLETFKGKVLKASLVFNWGQDELVLLKMYDQIIKKIT
jgi:glycosyltransferase involved in cell wall biosynthesis